ncbi:adenine phosphoribosyltransferase, partial [Phenoliferia sp. Uapishka_3]
MADIAHLKSLLGVHPDFPQKGIVFLDLFPILRDPVAFESLITAFLQHVFSVVIPRTPSRKIDVVVGLDARGFLLGPILALRLGAAFVPVRKVGKLPGKVVSATYEKEYGTDSFEMQEDAIKPGQSVIVIDDLIATGGSAKAAGELVAKLGGKVEAYLFIIEIMFLKGSAALDAPTFSLIED